MHEANNFIASHVAKINLKTDAAQIAYNSIIQDGPICTDGIAEPA